MYDTNRVLIYATPYHLVSLNENEESKGTRYKDKGWQLLGKKKGEKGNDGDTGL